MEQGKLAAGNYEWPFELVLNGDLPESIEGLDYSYIVYGMKATIGRSFPFKDITTRRHVRLIRTFDATSLELSHNMVCMASSPVVKAHVSRQLKMCGPTKSPMLSALQLKAWYMARGFI